MNRDESATVVHAQYIADISLALINRTGAYHVCRDLVGLLPQFFVAKRYWRHVLENEPHGLLRKLLGRAMLFEINHFKLASALLGTRARPVPNCSTLFFDPLYVLHTELQAHDVVLCHDIGPISHRDLYDSQTTARYADAYAAIKAVRPGIVFVSEGTRMEFVRYFGEDFRFLHVIPLYARPTLAQVREQAPFAARQPFLLTVGALESRKNYPRIIEAFVHSGLRERGYSYLFCGPRGNSASVIRSLAESAPGVRYLEFLSDCEIRWLYRHASGFVLPSLLEGFGLPALEAAQHGLVSVISRDPAQVEAVGDSAIQVDATSVGDIAEGLRQLVDMPESERTRRVAMARQHADRLTRDLFLQRWSKLLGAECATEKSTTSAHEMARGSDLETGRARKPAAT